MLPKALPSIVLLLMAIFCYGKRINWRDIKSSIPDLLKFIFVLFLAVTIEKAILYFENCQPYASFCLTSGFWDCLQIFLTVLVIVFWYRQNKKFKESRGEKVRSFSDWMASLGRSEKD